MEECLRMSINTSWNTKFLRKNSILIQESKRSVKMIQKRVLRYKTIEWSTNKLIVRMILRSLLSRDQLLLLLRYSKTLCFTREEFISHEERVVESNLIMVSCLLQWESGWQLRTHGAKNGEKLVTLEWASIRYQEQERRRWLVEFSIHLQ